MAPALQVQGDIQSDVSHRLTLKRSCATASLALRPDSLASAVARSTAAILASMPEASMASSSSSLPDVLASSSCTKSCGLPRGAYL